MIVVSNKNDQSVLVCHHCHQRVNDLHIYVCPVCLRSLVQALNVRDAVPVVMGPHGPVAIPDAD